MKRLPTHITRRAEAITAALKAGASPVQFRGKRVTDNRDLISIPVGRRHRLLCRDTKQGIQPLRVLTHEAYNHIHLAVH